MDRKHSPLSICTNSTISIVGSIAGKEEQRASPVSSAKTCDVLEERLSRVTEIDASNEF
jgi:hypothetical protein